MNLNTRPALLRWASAAVVAAGAITFVAADGYSYTRRLYMNVYASAPSAAACQGTYPNQPNATGFGFDASGNIVCEVNTSVTAGSTVFSAVPCSTSAVWVGAYANLLNISTGDTTPIGGGTGSWAPWGGSGSYYSPTYGTCAMQIEVEGK